MRSRSKSILFTAGMVLITASLACGLASKAPSYAPAAAIATQTPIALTPVISPGEPTQPATEPAPAIPERRRITLEYPPKIRFGDSDVIRLTFEVDKLGNVTPTAQFEGTTVSGGTVEIPNLYETHNVIAEARLDMAGLEVRPSELISSPLLPGQPVTFYWSVRPQQSGDFKGTVWLFLRFVDKATGEQSERAVSAQVIEIHTAELFGLSANFARTTGAIGSVVGGILGFPFLEEILKFIFRKRRQK